MVINGNNLYDEELKKNIQVGDYFIYYNTFMPVGKYWTLYRFEGFDDALSDPKHFLMCKCIGSSCLDDNKVNVVSGKVYRISVKDARVSHKASVIRNKHVLIAKIFIGAK